MKRVDLNCDMGEMAEAVNGGAQEELLRYVTSANVACGGHAGDARMMRATINQCLRHDVAIGGHPGYEDRRHFGRIELKLSREEVAASVHKQLLALEKIAIRWEARIGHVKPHGALYNQAAREREIARGIAEGVARWRRTARLPRMAALCPYRRRRFAFTGTRLGRWRLPRQCIGCCERLVWRLRRWVRNRQCLPPRAGRLPSRLWASRRLSLQGQDEARRGKTHDVISSRGRRFPGPGRR
jgi:LamB/YcsF family